jgi:hypothetical protein
VQVNCRAIADCRANQQVIRITEHALRGAVEKATDKMSARER